jgi:N-ethylmaleimide reductase
MTNGASDTVVFQWNVQTSQEFLMSIKSNQPLFEPMRLGDLELPNRIVMAPMTRMRSANPELVPTQLHAEYYAQRASAGLIIAEGAFVSPESVGYAHVPGLWSEAQVRGWSVVTDAVHRAGGRIVAQLWHTGSMGHPDFHAGEAPPSASAVNPEQQSVTKTGRKDTVVPRAMDKDEIRRTVADFGRAARNAMAAGFDGVQIQGGYHYLFNQFLNIRTNLRTDEYGGSTENRARFLFEVLEAVVEAAGAQRTGIKTGPATSETGAFVSNEETLTTSEYVITRLNDYDLQHLLLMGPMADLSATPLAELAGDGMFRHFREIYRGNIIANVDIDRARANRLLEAGLVDMVAFGRPFIANPDLPARFASDVPLAEIDWPKVYGPSLAEGYTDYPAFQAVPA